MHLIFEPNMYKWGMKIDNKREALLKIILENGADINAQDNNGRAILMITGMRYDGSMTSINMLKKYNPDLSIKDKDGKTFEDLFKEREERMNILFLNRG